MYSPVPENPVPGNTIILKFMTLTQFDPPVFNSKCWYFLLPLLFVDLDGVPLLIQSCSARAGGLQVDLN